MCALSLVIEPFNSLVPYNMLWLSKRTSDYNTVLLKHDCHDIKSDSKLYFYPYASFSIGVIIKWLASQSHMIHSSEAWRYKNTWIHG